MADCCVTASSGGCTIQKGNLVRSTGTFTNALDNYSPIDPDVVHCTVTEPDGTSTEHTYPATIEKTSIGAYYLEQYLDAAGVWYFRWWSEGNVVTSTQQKITVIDTIP